MKRLLSIVCAALMCSVFVGTLLAADPSGARTKEQVVADINAVPMPKLDQTKIKDKDYVTQYLKERNEAVQKRSELTGELYKLAPDAPELDKLLPERWSMMASPAKAPAAVSEIGEYLTKHPTSANVEQFAMLRAQIEVQVIAKTTPERLAAAEELKKYAKSDRATGMVASLMYTAVRLSKDEKEKTELTDRIMKEYPNSPVVTQIKGDAKKREAVGKPMVLAFNEAITGKPMSMETFKGKIVVMDFWATWCGPCIAEMPNMKKLYAEFKDKGVEFVGISLDQPEDKGGLKALKEYCAKNDITWPQYYQGNYWQSEFSMGWGINAIPCVFLIGPDGKIISTEARGQLEKMLPEQIKKRDDAKKAATE